MTKAGPKGSRKEKTVSGVSNLGVKIAVIGTGARGKMFAEILRKGSCLAGVFEKQYKNERELDYEIGGSKAGRVEDLVKSCKEIDAAVITGPAITHMAPAMALMKAGKHVLIDGMFSESVSNARKMVDAAKAAHVILSVGFPGRHNPAVNYVRDNLREKKFGNLISFIGRRVGPAPEGLIDIEGVMGNIAQEIDVIRYVTGSEVEMLKSTGGFGSEDHFGGIANVMLIMKGSLSGILEIDTLTPMNVSGLELMCLKKYLEADYRKQTVDIWSTKPSPEGTLDILETSGEAEHQQITPRKVDIIKTILDDFAGAIKNKRKPLVTGEDGVMALRVAQAAVENMEINKTTEMDEFPED